jgi:hypothetical protein
VDNFVEQLVASEGVVVTEVMAFMSYNPSIGRVLEKGGVAKFQDMMRGVVEKLPKVQSQQDSTLSTENASPICLRTSKRPEIRSRHTDKARSQSTSFSRSMWTGQESRRMRHEVGLFHTCMSRSTALL